VQLSQVSLAELGHEPVPFGCELNTDDAGVDGVGAAPHKTRRLGAVHEFDRTVVTQQEIPRKLANGRRDRPGMAFDGDKKLMLDVGEPNRLGLLLAPALKAAQAHAESKKVFEVLAGWLVQTGPPIGSLEPPRTGA